MTLVTIQYYNRRHYIRSPTPDQEWRESRTDFSHGDSVHLELILLGWRIDVSLSIEDSSVVWNNVEGLDSIKKSSAKANVNLPLIVRSMSSWNHGVRSHKKRCYSHRITFAEPEQLACHFINKLMPVCQFIVQSIDPSSVHLYSVVLPICLFLPQRVSLDQWASRYNETSLMFQPFVTSGSRTIAIASPLRSNGSKFMDIIVIVSVQASQCCWGTKQ
jgi:hypothetical protein